MAPPTSSLAPVDEPVPAALSETGGERSDELDLEALNGELAGWTPQAILAWAAATFRGRVCLQSSMQKRASVLAHMLATEGLRDVPVLFVDTGFHFAETLAMRDRLESEHGLRVIAVRPDLTPAEQAACYGVDLWRSPETYRLCCHLRKELPFVRAASAFDAVISGLQPGEGGARSRVRAIDRDPRIGAWVIHPLAVWSREQLDAYVASHAIELHPLYERGYASIGCATCTTPVEPGEDERAGRWRHIREALEAEGERAGTIYCHLNWVDRPAS
jgi:phosphoadenosine phosphosulfate reductase